MSPARQSLVAAMINVVPMLTALWMEWQIRFYIHISKFDLHFLNQNELKNLNFGYKNVNGLAMKQTIWVPERRVFSGQRDAPSHYEI